MFDFGNVNKECLPTNSYSRNAILLLRAPNPVFDEKLIYGDVQITFVHNFFYVIVWPYLKIEPYEDIFAVNRKLRPNIYQNNVVHHQG